MHLKINTGLFLIPFFLLFQSCKSSEEDSIQENTPSTKIKTPIIQELKPELNKTTPSVETPVFNEDSSFTFIEKQVDFGPRVRNYKEHENCANWIVSKMTSYGFDVIVQKGKVTAFDGTQLNIKNIISRHNPDEKGRILLCAHWDTRPFADEDTVNIFSPIDGANDGASGVGILMEVARNISAISPGYGIDIIFFDAEDYGASKVVSDLRNTNATWCLGSQYWCKNPVFKDYHPKFGILLDMVGGKDAKFYKEGISVQYANKQLKTIWNEAINLGYYDYFINKLGGEITDDHVYLNKISKIPTIDIIDYGPNEYNNFTFGKFWHTHSDKIDIIHKPTLKAVGQTLLHILYQKI